MYYTCLDLYMNFLGHSRHAATPGEAPRRPTDRYQLLAGDVRLRSTGGRGPSASALLRWLGEADGARRQSS